MGIHKFLGEKKHPKTVVLGVLLVMVLMFSGLWLSGCEDKAKMKAYYAKEHAGKRALVYLVSYTHEHEIPLEGFEGPYFEEVVGLDYPVYIVCYKHPGYFFLYDDHAKQLQVTLAKDIDPNNALYQEINRQSATLREQLKKH